MVYLSITIQSVAPTTTTTTTAMIHAQNTKHSTRAIASSNRIPYGTKDALPFAAAAAAFLLWPQVALLPSAAALCVELPADPVLHPLHFVVDSRSGFFDLASHDLLCQGLLPLYHLSDSGQFLGKSVPIAVAPVVVVVVVVMGRGLAAVIAACLGRCDAVDVLARRCVRVPGYVRSDVLDRAAGHDDAHDRD